MVDLSTEPFAIGENGEVVRIGSLVTYRSGRFLVTDVRRPHDLDGESFVALLPDDDRARVVVDFYGVAPDGSILIESDSVRPEGTPVRHI